MTQKYVAKDFTSIGNRTIRESEIFTPQKGEEEDVKNAIRIKSIEPVKAEVAEKEDAKKGDALTKIEGIGPATANQLAELEITTTDALKSAISAGNEQVIAALKNNAGKIAETLGVQLPE